jgi:hypothetical protein
MKEKRIIIFIMLSFKVDCGYEKCIKRETLNFNNINAKCFKFFYFELFPRKCVCGRVRVKMPITTFTEFICTSKYFYP